MNYIQMLIKVNPAADYEKKGRWDVIVESYLVGQTFLGDHKNGLTLAEIADGLELKKGSAAWGSMYAALRRGCERQPGRSSSMLAKAKDGRAFRYRINA